MAWRKSNVLRDIKAALLPSGLGPRTILTGPFKGIRMELDLQGQSQIYAGLYEREVFSEIRRLAKGVRSVVDIGACDGEYTLYSLLKTRAERVIAIEPDQAMVDKLGRNLKLNALEQDSRLEIWAKYIGPSDGDNIIGAEHLCDRIQTPCFIKMDIEGVEGVVLRVLAPRLQGPGLRWLIEVHSHALRDECESVLASCGYTTRRISQAWWRTFVPELRGTEVGWLVATK